MTFCSTHQYEPLQANPLPVPAPDNSIKGTGFFDNRLRAQVRRHGETKSATIFRLTSEVNDRLRELMRYRGDLLLLTDRRGPHIDGFSDFVELTAVPLLPARPRTHGTRLRSGQRATPHNSRCLPGLHGYAPGEQRSAEMAREEECVEGPIAVSDFVGLDLLPASSRWWQSASQCLPIIGTPGSDNPRLRGQQRLLLGLCRAALRRSDNRVFDQAWSSQTRLAP